MPDKEFKWGDIVVVHPNGEYELRECENTLENMQSLVGGYVQVVPLFNKFEGRPCAVLCDEEGKLKGKPINNRATLEWAKNIPIGNEEMLVGDIVVLTGNAWRKWR